MQELMTTIHQILVTMTGSAGALALAAIVGRCLPRILRGKSKAPRDRRFKTDHGEVRFAVMITIGGEGPGRKSLHDAEDDGWDEAA